MKRISSFIPEPLLKRLKELAKRTDISVGEHIRRAIEAYLNRLGK